MVTIAPSVSDGRTTTKGAPSERASAATVRGRSELLKTSTARERFMSALVGTAWTWRGSRGGSRTATRCTGGRGGAGAGSAGTGTSSATGSASSRRGGVAARAQPRQQRAAALAAALADSELLGGHALADPALVGGARRAQLAHVAARAAGEEDGGRLAAQQRATADVALQDRLVGGDLTGRHQDRRP